MRIAYNSIYGLKSVRTKHSICVGKDTAVLIVNKPQVVFDSYPHVNIKRVVK